MPQPQTSLERRVFEDLREHLIDRTRRNRLLHFSHSTRTSIIRIVDEAPEAVVRHLQEDGQFRFRPLPDPDTEPADERTPAFRTALAKARLEDEAYRTGLAAIDPDDPSAAAKEAALERALRNRVRGTLGLPPRPTRKSIDRASFAREHGIEPSYDLATAGQPRPAKHGLDSLQTLLFADELGAKLSRVDTTAREVEQETGVSTLHLAIGFLNWFESKASADAFSSPLLLLPVRLERHRTRGGEAEFRLSAMDSRPATNLSLELRLRDDFRLTLPSVDLGEDGAVETYLAAVAETIRGREGWHIRRFLTLAPFSFARIAMYKDLDPANWHAEGGGPESHTLVRRLLRAGAEEPEAAANPGFADEYEIDRPEVERLAPILVHDADSSQHSAIIDAMQGRSLVVEGPPGTGKSQTIANLIANVLYQGGRVLFVAEKMAALEVVKARLDRVGLGPFCLPLHAAGAKPAAVIQALHRREAIVAPSIPRGDATQQQAWSARQELRSHLDALHAQAGPQGETVHVLIGRMAELARVLPQLPRLLRTRGGDLPATIAAAAPLEARRRLEALEAAATPPERPDWNPSLSPFRRLDRFDLFPDEQEALFSGLDRVIAVGAALCPASAAFADQIGEIPPTTTEQLQSMLRRAAALGDPDPLVDRLLLARLVSAEAVAVARAAAESAVVADAAQEKLAACGLVDPGAVPADHLATADLITASLGLAKDCVGDVAEAARRAATEVETLAADAPLVEMLISLTACAADPPIGVVVAACAAAELAADADPAWHPHCRHGLERHVAALERAAERQAALDGPLRGLRERLDLDRAGHAELRSAAAALRRGGLLAAFRAERRDARRLFARLWRHGRPPRRAEWAPLLEAAVAILAEAEAFRSDETVVLVMIEGVDPLLLPLRQIAAAASWQQRVAATFIAAPLGAVHLGGALLSLDPPHLAELALLAEPARALRVLLGAAERSARETWSAMRRTAAARAEALAQLARLLAVMRLRADVPMGELAALAGTARDWQQATARLRSPHALAIVGDAAIGSDRLRATVAFAESVYETAPSAAATLLGDGWSAAIAGLRAAATVAQDAAADFEAAVQALAPLGLRTALVELASIAFSAIRAKAHEMRAAARDLPAYLGFAIARAACREDPLARPVIDAFESASAPLRHLPEALEWLVGWRVVRDRAETDRAVFNRTGFQLSTLRRAFAAADHDRKRCDALLVAAAAGRRPVPAGTSVGSRKEWTDGALLQNEFAKQRRHVPLRDLFSRAGDAVLALTPCLMMSPLTVAQYLRPGRIGFDLVIMDEASQIRPEDALGAFLRARQVVVVGDPQQLPPTNFFDRALANDDEEDEESEGLAAEDKVVAESVLDIAARAFRPARQLRWHYRSQHESLIAFSNREFYDSRLVIFPTAQPSSETLGIEFVPVAGRWSERTNSAEAKGVATAVVAFMLQHRDLSHGVVAMNQPQRELIEAEIDLLAAGDVEVAAYRERWHVQHEPPFVKNLENVQGDERDVIFVSLGWGRTPEGALHQRFYPVNRLDGHRRLNVLFTRAKRQIVIFASLQPEQIVVDPDRTARGVRVLRDYLLYARDGRIEPGRVEEEEAEAESPFEASVFRALRAHGHDVALQVGVAGYRIDLAVRHPQRREHFVLGIECDGAAYHSAKSARDRDRLRQEALERLGWRLTRVWSTDWFRDPATTTERLCAEIAEAIRMAHPQADASIRLVPIETTKDTDTPLPSTAGTPAPPAPVQEEAGPSLPPPQPGPEVPQQLSSLSPALNGAADLPSQLRRFRDGIILRDLPGSDSARGILRETMIEAIIRSELDDRADFHGKIPERLRSGTDGRQMRYLDQICEIVADAKNASVLHSKTTAPHHV